MSDPYEVVYQAEPPWAKQVVRFLRSRGFRPFNRGMLEREPEGTGIALACGPAIPTAAALASWQRRKLAGRK